MSTAPKAPTGSAPQAPCCEALQAVMFDMDGLLVDTEPLWFEVEREVMARLGGTWSHADQARLIGGSLATSVGHLLAKAASPAGTGPQVRVGARGQPAPVAATEAAADAVARWLVDGLVARITADGAPLLPGAAELLAELASAGVPCALVTSSERAVMDAVLAGLGPAITAVIGRALPAVFRATVCAADVSRTKPDAEPYLLAASLLGADPARCVVFEDAPNGVTAAEAAGCLVVVVPGMVAVEPRADRVKLRSLHEASVPMLRGLAASRAASAR